MGMIAILDENTINKIAAGEVVDRPASIVKELVENAIDAGATSITVEIKNGGISYIKITDNGSGIARDDVRLAFERHATSKIRKEEDILKIRSMGFRGEALASVASIAKVTLETKKKDEYTGTRYVIEGGQEKDFEEIAWNAGTSICVENVFYNVPARYKFLKKDYTEAGYIEDVVARIALVNPNISFKYINNGKKILQTIGNGDMKTIVFNVFGKEAAEELWPVQYESENYKISGVIGTPKLSRSTRQNEFIYVNSRYIKDKTITTALEKAFEQNLNIGKFPFAILNIEIPSEEVDVNVHPTKLEVKFENENKIFDLVYNSIKNALLEYHRTTSPFAMRTEEPSVVEENYNTYHEIIESDVYEVSEVQVVQEVPLYKGPIKSEYIATQDVSYITEETAVKIEDLAPSVAENKSNYETKIPYKYIGNLFNTYILIEMNEKLYIIDQHAAHERLIFEQVKAIYYSKEKQTQMLLIPSLIELKNSEKELVKENMEMFNSAGFILEDFGDNAFKVAGVPNIGYDVSYEDLFKDILDSISDKGTTASVEREKRFIYTIACKAAVKANMTLTKEEHIALIDRMMKLDRPFTCPHGRPTAFEVSKYEIERRFSRK